MHEKLCTSVLIHEICPILFPPRFFLNPIPSPVLKKTLWGVTTFCEKPGGWMFIQRVVSAINGTRQGFLQSIITSATNSPVSPLVFPSRSCQICWTEEREIYFLEAHSRGNKRVKNILPKLSQPQPHRIMVKRLSMFCAFFSSNECRRKSLWPKKTIFIVNNWLLRTLFTGGMFTAHVGPPFVFCQLIQLEMLKNLSWSRWHEEVCPDIRKSEFPAFLILERKRSCYFW